MSAGKGFLLVTMEPPAATEEEFKDWYDTEHVPERLATVGFETATRYVCTAGWPRYLAFYDLATPQVIDSPGYRAISGENFSPWTKRMLARVRGFYRAFGEQIYAATAEPTAGASSALAGRTLLVRVRCASGLTDNEWIAGARRAFEAREDLLGLRVLRSAPAAGGDLLAMVDLDASAARTAADVGGFGSARRHFDLLNEYVAMSRSVRPPQPFP